MKAKYNHLPLKAYEVYSKPDYVFSFKEYSFGIHAGHTAGQAKARVAIDREVDNPWRGLATRRVHGPEAELAIAKLNDRGKYWRDKAENVRLQAECDAFNAKYPVGTPVQVVGCCEASNWPDGMTKLRTPAWVSGPGCALVSVEGYSGGFYMEYIKPL